MDRKKVIRTLDRSKSFLGTENIRKLFIRTVIPTVFAQLITLIYNIVDRIYIGHIPGIGSEALTGVGVCMPIMIIVSAFAQLFAAGGAPRISVLYGKQQNDEARRLLGVCSFFLSAVGIVITAAGLILARKALLQFGASANTLPYALSYLRIYICGSVFSLLSVGLSAFITAQGFTGVSLRTVAVGAMLNIILDPLFIFAFHMDVQGAALATVISQFISALYALVFLFGKKPALQLMIRNVRPDFVRVLPCVTLGLSPFIMTLTECFVSIAFNRSLLHYGGDMAVGAMTVFSAIMQIAVLPLQGLSQGAQPITSYNFGAGNRVRVSASVRLLITTSVLYAGVLWLCILLFPRQAIGIFTRDTRLVSLGVQYIRVYFASLIMMGIQFSCQNSFVALGNAKTSIFLALLRKGILLIPLIYILPCFITETIFAVFLAEPVTDFIAATTTLILFYRSYRKDLFPQGLFNLQQNDSTEVSDHTE